jgi:hypothetical protein
MVFVYTFFTDETRIQYLRESALLNNIEICYLKKDTWNGYVDKIIAMNHIITKHVTKNHAG